MSPKAVFIDGIHIEANANTDKQIKAAIPAASKHYAKELMEEVNADREAHRKKPFDDDDDPPSTPKKRKNNTSRKEGGSGRQRTLYTKVPASLISSGKDH